MLRVRLFRLKHRRRHHTPWVPGKVRPGSHHVERHPEHKCTINSISLNVSKVVADANLGNQSASKYDIGQVHLQTDTQYGHAIDTNITARAIVSKCRCDGRKFVTATAIVENARKHNCRKQNASADFNTDTVITVSNRLYAVVRECE